MENLFEELKDYDILSAEGLSVMVSKLELKKSIDILNKHPHKIWQGKNGKWYTYLPNGKVIHRLVQPISSMIWI